MTTPVESLKGSIRQSIASLRRDAPAARFIGEQVVNLVGQAVLRRIRQEPTEGSGAIEMKTGEVFQHAHQSSPCPWPDYDVMTAREVIAEIQRCSRELLLAVRHYEDHHRSRSTVLAAVDTALAAGQR